jgi:phosphatidate cytidylyltransferase
VITAVILVVTLITAVLTLPLAGLALLFGGVVAIAAWEWSRLMSLEAIWARLLYVAAMAGLLGLIYGYCRLGAEPQREEVQSLLGVAGLWWAIALLWIKGYPASARLWGSLPMLSLMGALVLAPAWLAVIYLLSFEQGGYLLLYLVVVVAAADIGAYFAGHRWGQRKLSPDVSPGKSWEGFWGGMAACATLALLTHLFLPAGRLGLPGILAIVLSAALASVLGDLLESMVKRHRGVKDSGVLLPGHGGFLDRIDGYTAAAPVFALGLILAGW